MIKGNKRLHHESQAGYRKRLKREKQAVEGWLRGRRIWYPAAQGTYVRARHGEIGSRAN